MNFIYVFHKIVFTYVGISARVFFFRSTLWLYKNVLLKVGNVLLIKYIFKICSVSVLLFRLQKYVLLLHFFHLIFLSTCISI